jgi:hypothetical protein
MQKLCSVTVIHLQLWDSNIFNTGGETSLPQIPFFWWRLQGIYSLDILLWAVLFVVPSIPFQRCSIALLLPWSVITKKNCEKGNQKSANRFNDCCHHHLRYSLHCASGWVSFLPYNTLSKAKIKCKVIPAFNLNTIAWRRMMKFRNKYHWVRMIHVGTLLQLHIKQLVCSHRFGEELKFKIPAAYLNMRT